jgi:hypothetical protein
MSTYLSLKKESENCIGSIPEMQEKAKKLLQMEKEMDILYAECLIFQDDIKEKAYRAIIVTSKWMSNVNYN